MTGSQFVYVTYIRSNPEKIWEALTTPAFQRKFWFGMHQECDFKPGSPWKLVFQDGRIADEGEILESDPPRRLVIKWRNAFRPELTEEGYGRCEYLLEPDREITRLTITHTIERESSKLIEAVSGGWPRILSSLKTMLEGGEPLPSTHPKAAA